MKPYKLIYRLIKFKPWLYLIGCIMAIVTSLIPLVSGLIIRDFFNALNKNDYANFRIWFLISLFFFINISRILSVYFNAVLEILERFFVSALIRRNLLEILLQKKHINSSDKSVGEIISNFRDDVSQIEDFINSSIRLVGYSIYAVAAIIILFKINDKITICLLVLLLIVATISKLASSKISKYRTASRESSVLVTGALGEIFSSVQAIQLANAESYILEHLKLLNKRRQKLILKDNIFSQILNSIFDNSISIGIGITLLISAKSVKDGSFSIGDFSIFIYYLNFITDFIQDLGIFIAEYTQVNVSFKRLSEMIKGVPTDALVKNSSVYLKGEIPIVTTLNKKNNNDILRSLEVKNLNYKYPNSKFELKDIDLKIKKNSITVITGVIGSGKSTLIKTLLGLLPLDTGDIYWNEQKIEDISSFFIPPRSAYVPQVPQLFSDSICNNILLGLNPESVNMDKSIYLSVLEQDLHDLENGLETLIGPRGVKLSGGQQQRISIARMFIRDSELLVLDDVSSALDVRTEVVFWKRLFENLNKTYIVVSTKKAILERADQIIVLKDGMVAAQGSLKYLLENCEEFKHIWES